MGENIEINVACNKYNNFCDIFVSIPECKINQNSFTMFSVDDWGWKNKLTIKDNCESRILGHKIIVIEGSSEGNEQYGGYQYIDDNIFFNILWFERRNLLGKKYDLFLSKIEREFNIIKSKIGLLYACVGCEMYIESSSNLTSMIEQSSGVDRWFFANLTTPRSM